MQSVIGRDRGTNTEAQAAGWRKSQRETPIIAVVAFATFALLWAGFAAALVWSQGRLDLAWAWIQGLPLPFQVGAWLLFLPVVAGLWVWEASWPLAVRLVLVAGLGVFSLYAFFPRALFAGRR